MSRRRAAMVALVASIIGCTDDGTGPRAGAWEGLVTGTVHRALSGFATFGTVLSDDGDGDFLIELLAGNGQPTVLIEIRSPLPGPPPTGELPVQPQPAAGAVAVTFLQMESDGSLSGSLRGQSGIIAIHSATGGRVSGEFDVTVTGYLSTDGVAVPDARLDVAGVFSAIAAD